MIQRIKLAKNEAHTPHPTTLNKPNNRPPYYADLHENNSGYEAYR